jgi:hypothetical protein
VTSGAAMVKCSILELKSAAPWAPAGFQNSVLALSCGFGLPVGPQVTAQADFWKPHRLSVTSSASIASRMPTRAGSTAPKSTLSSAELALLEHAHLAVDALADGSADHRRPSRRGRREVSPPAR